VNGESIMLSELLARLRELGIEEAQYERIAGNVLDGLIDDVLLVQFLSAQKLPYDAKAVDAQLAAIRAETEKQGKKLSEVLAELGVTEQKLRAAVIAEARFETYMKQRITEKDLTEHFAKYREYFDGTQVRASHILVEVPAGASESTRRAAQARAEHIRKELAAGLEFGEAAKKYSNCPSKDQGGDVEWFPRGGKMVEPFARAAFALKVGETSGVVETEFGYHIIRCTGRKPGTRTKLTDPALRQDVIESLGERMKQEIIAQQQKTAKIEYAPGIPATRADNASTPSTPQSKSQPHKTSSGNSSKKDTSSKKR
jgi:parvulin-like peptidyl-prolyl isomerase